MGLSTAAWIGIGSAVASAAGTGISYMASQASSSAASKAQYESLLAQNTAFQSRSAAKQAQTAEEAGITDASQANYQAIESAMRDSESKALSDRQTAIDKMNAAEQAVQQETAAKVADTTQQQVTAQSLAQAQAQSEAARNAAVQPTVQDIKASAPITAGEGGNRTVDPTRSAMAEAMSNAADYTQKYGASLAKLASYSQPLTDVALKTEELKYGLLPAAARDQLLKAGVANLLQPSTTAYQNAKDYGTAAITANTANTTDAMSLAQKRATYAADEANQYQTDTTNNIQSGLNVTQARDASISQLGSGISSLANVGLAYAGGKGAFSELFGGGSGGMATGTELTNLSKQAAGNIAGGAAI